jgi:hypothetical protein
LPACLPVCLSVCRSLCRSIIEAEFVTSNRTISDSSPLPASWPLTFGLDAEQTTCQQKSKVNKLQMLRAGTQKHENESRKIVLIAMQNSFPPDFSPIFFIGLDHLSADDGLFDLDLTSVSNSRPGDISAEDLGPVTGMTSLPCGLPASWRCSVWNVEERILSRLFTNTTFIAARHFQKRRSRRFKINLPSLGIPRVVSPVLFLFCFSVDSQPCNFCFDVLRVGINWSIISMYM